MEIGEIIDTFKNSDNFWVGIARDALSVLVILALIGVLSQLFFGLWTPMVAVESGSMEPHMYRGDIIFIEDLDRTQIETLRDAPAEYISFGKKGDVILYQPYGQKEVTPVIHRAMYFVEEGEQMWEGGSEAPHAGYVTKGDNAKTNSYYDQQGQISYLNPVKEEWIIGVARYKIPYIGHIRLLLS
ncbi:signal peptidase I [Methanohalophilus sp.]